MIRPRLVLLPLALVLAAPAFGQGTVSSLKGHDANAPVDVSADRIELQDRDDRAVFTGNVKATQGDMTVDSARMTVAYAKTPGTDNPQVQRIDASGNVVVTSPSETARGQFAIYDLNRRLITMLGAVTLTRGTNNVNGARLVINLDTGRATVDGNPVGGTGGTTTGPGGRVTGRFTVPPRTTTTTPATTTPPAK